MQKMMMMLTLLVVSAVSLVLPGAVSAQEIHFEGPTTFTGTGAASSWVSTGEPTTTCESVDFNNGTISAGGTTGTMTLDFTGCHATVLGFTVKCHTTGSPADNTIASGGTFHLITWKNAAGTAFPAILITLNTTEYSCAGISNTHLEGNLIGTITSPACGSSSTEMKLGFTATGSTQNHLEYTGVKYDLLAKTSGGSPLTAALNLSATLHSAAGKLNCT